MIASTGVNRATFLCWIMMQNISAALNIEVRQADDKAQNGSVTDQHAKTEIEFILILKEKFVANHCMIITSLS